MCGIFGHYAPAGADPALVERMARALAHRGPDGWGMAHEGAFAFGAGRLAIIDLSAPAGVLFNEDRRIAVAFNGEIYNYKTLHAELERRGHHFVTRTDTEVIVHGYEEWGVDVLTRLRGMFAICLYDAGKARYLLARDRAGEKPLYYARVNGDEWIFASEAKALFEHPRLKAAVNHEALPHFLSVGYVPPPLTLFAGVNKLAPAEYMLIEQGNTCRDFYWQPHIDTHNAPPYEVAVQQVRAKLTECVEMQMMSDVPIGTFLSGGVDSTAVAALMQRASRQPINTFTVGFDMPAGSSDDHKFNVDARYAALAARDIGSHHHEIRLRADDSLPALLPRLVYMMDEPAQMATFVQSVYVAGLARSKGVPVLLNGEAGDELFMGYNYYRGDLQLTRYLALPALLRENILNPLLEKASERTRKLVHKSRQQDPALRYLEWARILRFEELAPMLADQPLAANASATVTADLRPLLANSGGDSFTERLASANLRRVVAENFNMRVDKMSMAMSIETRAPYEDHEMIELAFRMPLHYKLRGGHLKRILKDAVRPFVPAAVLKRPKWGFNPPQSKWLRTCLRDLVYQTLSRERIEAVGIFKADIVARLLHCHIVEGKYEMMSVWSLLVFHLWHALYIERSLTFDRPLTHQDITQTLTSSPVST
jgi:asparagine synthase (glutamine-hydrolysing)